MITIKSNVKAFCKTIEKHKKQMRYATAVAINETLKGARPYLIRHIKRRQTSKRAWWANKRDGINRTFANKRRLQGSIYTRMYWAWLQETGGIKTPHEGRKLAIPTKSTPKSRRKAGGARRMMTQKKTFFAKMDSGKSGIWRRKTKKRLPIELLYTLDDKAMIDRPYLHFRKTVEKYVRRNFPKNHHKAYMHAIKTAR
jgi:hypothetical protein